MTLKCVTLPCFLILLVILLIKANYVIFAWAVVDWVWGALLSTHNLLF